MGAAKVYFYFFYNTLVHSPFHAVDHSEFVETLVCAGFTQGQFCTVFEPVKMTVPFRGHNFSAGLVCVCVTAFYVPCTLFCDCFTLI